MEDRYEIEHILDPRDIADLERIDAQNHLFDEIMNKPVELALGAVRRATDGALEARAELRYWKNLEERQRFEAAELRSELKASRNLVRYMLASCAVLAGVVVFFGARLWR